MHPVVPMAVIRSIFWCLLAIAPAHAQGPALPEQVAGFRFGATTREAARACRRAGLHWERVDGYPDRFWCDGTPASIGEPATTIVDVCSGRVCGIGLVVDADSNGATIAAYRDLQRELQRRYGSARPVVESTGTAQRLCEYDAQQGTYRLVQFGGCRLVQQWRVSGGGIALLLTGEMGSLSVMIVYGLFEGSERAQERAL